MKKIVLNLLLLLSVSISFSQTPPDAPIDPQVWVDKMGFGQWWLFRIPPDPDNNFLVDNYSPKIIDTMRNKFCFTGGRLHWNAMNAFDNNDVLSDASIDVVENMVDDFLARDMAISLNIQFLNWSNQTNKNMGAAVKQKYKDAWEKLCIRFKGKSHNLAMCPVIEFHAWDDLPQATRQANLNNFYDELTLIFRQYNPTRIISYKPWGSSKHAEFDTLAYPFGNDPLPSSGQPFYYVSSFSGSAGMGAWDTWSPTMSQADLDELHFVTMNAGGNHTKVWGINAAVMHRTNTGVPFWMDHWRPNYHKSANDPANQWTMDQNIAYADFFMDKMKAVNSAGAMFQTRTFWNDQTDDLIRQTPASSDGDIMSVMFMNLLENKCQVLSVSDVEKPNKISIYPNPARQKITLEKDGVASDKIQLFDFLGKDISSLAVKNRISSSKIELNITSLEQGVYFLKINGVAKKIIKE